MGRTAAGDGRVAAAVPTAGCARLPWHARDGRFPRAALVRSGARAPERLASRGNTAARTKRLAPRRMSSVADLTPADSERKIRSVARLSSSQTGACQLQARGEHHVERG